MDENKKKLWKQAIKWPLYSVAILPVFITGAYLLDKYEKVKIYNLVAFTLAAILILIWENLTNDLFDAETGIDEFKFHSIVNLVKNKKVISFEELLENFWVNIDPFDAYGQFCDKGYSYRSVAFYQNDEEKKLIEKDIKDLQNKFNKKVVTYIRNFEKFYKAEEYHQDFYKIKLERYLRYKKACGREELLKRIWSQ